MILAVVLSALVLLGWSMVSRTLLSDRGAADGARRERQDEAGPAAAGHSGCRARRRHCAAAPPCSAQRRGCGSKRRASRARSISRARASTTSCCCASARASPRTPRRCGCLSPAGAPGGYFASVSAGAGDGVQAPPADAVWTASATGAYSRPPGHADLDRRRAGSASSRSFASTTATCSRSSRRVANGGSGAVAVRPYGLVSRANKSPDPDRLDRCTSGRSAYSTARPITMSTGRRSTRQAPTASISPAVAAGSASPTNIG